MKNALCRKGLSDICGFRIEPSQGFLAKHFVPPFPPETEASGL